MRIFWSFFYFILIISVLSFTCNLCHGYALGFMIPFQALAALVSDYRIEGYDNANTWQCLGFVFGCLHLLLAIKNRGPIRRTVTIVDNTKKVHYSIL